MIVATTIVVVALIVVLALVLMKRPVTDSIAEEDPVQDNRTTSETESSVDSVDAPTLPTETRVRHAWSVTTVDAVNESLVPSYKETVEGRELVELASDLNEWQQNDQVLIDVPQTQEKFLVTIAQVSTSLGNNRSYKGKMMPDENAHSFLITVGERNVFANFSTPEGRFELVGNTQYAWLMPSENMDMHVDYTQDDYYIPELDGELH